MSAIDPTKHPSRLTDETLTALGSLISITTPGPWRVPKPHGSEGAHVVVADEPTASEALVIANTLWPMTQLSTEPETAAHNAEFIAEARNWMPRLIQEVRRLRRENACLREVADNAERYLSVSQGDIEAEEEFLARRLSFSLDEWAGLEQEHRPKQSA